MIQLPEEFLKRMEGYLGEDFKAFIDSLQDEQVYGLRLNKLKLTEEKWEEIAPWPLEGIPWVEGGYFYQDSDRPGKHPYHEAGLYYIQEPSAMAVVEAMDPQPGEKILDLAAAPGGKATQIASRMQGKGFLLANDIHPKRSRALSQNIERLGIKHAVVTNERPNRLVKHFPNFFDRILLDAPCSGEGMFRKDEEAISHWSMENVKTCASRQVDLLGQADQMLKPGGQIVYSTCTFAPEENEQVIQEFLQDYPHYRLEQVDIQSHFAKGRRDWVETGQVDLDKTVRIWPHQVAGEGHFLAVLRKTASDERASGKVKALRAVKNKKRLALFDRFAKEHLQVLPEGPFVFFGDELYQVPEDMVDLDGLTIVRAGWHLGTMKKNRFEPSHALALGLKPEEATKVYDLAADSEEVYKYLKGETFSAEGSNAWYLITVSGFPLGWGKLVNGMMKNHYPKGLRWLSV